MASLRSTLHCVLLVLVLILNISTTNAFKSYIDSAGTKDQCGGMYAGSPGKNDSEIRVVMDQSSKGHAVVVVFEWNDLKYIGKRDANDEKVYICDAAAQKDGLCTEAQLGQPIIDTTESTSIGWKALDFTDEETNGIQYYEYPIHQTGYYCVVAWSVNVNNQGSYFSGVLEFNNKYGTLAGSDFPKLPFYGTLSLVYMTIGISWMVLCAKHWREILTVQHFISGVIFFLMVEMAFNWGYWDNYNKSGESSVALLVLVSILNSARNSLSLFMLLIVSMGYGVVKPTLGSTMKKVIILSLAQFLFGIIYSAGTMSPVDDVSTMIVLLVVVPLSVTMTCFYIWTLRSLTSTIATLNLRRQTEKVKMYTRLWRLLVFSLTALCIFFVFNTFTFMNMDDDDWPAEHWRIKWFLLDGWLNILYLIVFTVIVILWRPTANNKRYGIEQLETEDYDEADEHADHNNARAAESMGLTGMKLRPQRRDYELDDDQAAMFDIGEEEDEEDEDDDQDDDDIENGGRPGAQRMNSNNEGGSSSRGLSPAFRTSPVLGVA
ncbi:hypothetical protein FBU30_009062 [Linnemannia zychae]|nr:hypothetical protein FBU30_009062 [Linnemannia zychae]